MRRTCRALEWVTIGDTPLEWRFSSANPARYRRRGPSLRFLALSRERGRGVHVLERSAHDADRVRVLQEVEREGEERNASDASSRHISAAVCREIMGLHKSPNRESLPRGWAAILKYTLVGPVVGVDHLRHGRVAILKPEILGRLAPEGLSHVPALDSRDSREKLLIGIGWRGPKGLRVPLVGGASRARVLLPDRCIPGIHARGVESKCHPTRGWNGPSEIKVASRPEPAVAWKRVVDAHEHPGEDRIVELTRARGIRGTHPDQRRRPRGAVGEIDRPARRLSQAPSGEDQRGAAAQTRGN